MEEDLFAYPNPISIILNTSKSLKNKIIKVTGLKFLKKINTKSLCAIILKLIQKLEILFYLIVEPFIAILAL
jgi:hypothetical protein